MVVSVDQSFIENLMCNDINTFYEDLKKPLLNIKSSNNLYPLFADFTEYSPLHNGHLHCMVEAKKLHGDALFVAVIPGLFERNGRGQPYIMSRYMRAKTAIETGADIVVEGPPMGIMGSGQYSLCLAKMFKALNADYIPRGYVDNDHKFKIILSKINNGIGVAPKPYKIVSMEDNTILLNGKLKEDNYVIVSLSKSLTKINFNFKDRFIFIPRIENVSGTKIREYSVTGKFDKLASMVPDTTLKILKKEIENGHAPLHESRCNDFILDHANNYSENHIRNLTLLDNKTKDNIIFNRPFSNIESVINNIEHGFSRHQKLRILSVLEAGILKDEIHKYINNYPQVIRILDYKNRDSLTKFKDNLNHNIIGDNRNIWQLMKMNS
ncbi:MAG: nucleotidyltransferase family protein [Methanobacteriaceae archaeon]|nr:nucleotidyltransferase family protein [Methanobacteriaceae archaeon]